MSPRRSLIFLVSILLLLVSNSCGSFPSNDEWKSKTLALLEDARAIDGGYTGYVQPMFSPQTTYFSLLLLDNVGIKPLFLEETAEAIKSALSNEAPTTSENDWTTLDESFFLMAALQGLNDTQEMSDFRLRNLKLVLSNLASAKMVAINETFGGYSKAFLTQKGDYLSISNWLSGVEKLIFLQKLNGWPPSDKISENLLQLWQDNEFWQSQRPFNMTLLLSLLHALTNLNYEPQLLPEYNQHIQWIRQRFVSLNSQILGNHEWPIYIDLAAAIETMNLLNEKTHVSAEIVERLSSLQLSDGGFDFFISQGGFYPSHTLMALKIFEASSVEYPHKDRLLATLRENELESGGFRQKVIRYSDLGSTYASIASYDMLNARPPEVEYLSKYLSKELSKLNGDLSSTGSYELYLLFKSLNFVHGPRWASKLKLKIEPNFHWSIESRFELAQAYYLIRVMDLLDYDIPTQDRDMLTKLIVRRQDNSGAFSFNDGYDLFSTFYAIETLDSLGGLSDEIRNSAFEWLEQWTHETSNSRTNFFLEVYQAAALFRTLGGTVPKEFIEWVESRRNQRGGFADGAVEDVYWGLKVLLNE